MVGLDFDHFKANLSPNSGTMMMHSRDVICNHMFKVFAFMGPVFLLLLSHVVSLENKGKTRKILSTSYRKIKL